MVSAAESPERVQQHHAFVNAAADAGVAHLVYLSSAAAAAASPTATFTLARDHWDTEEHIKASGMAHTFLRDNIYADLFPYLAGEDGVLRGPAADGAPPWRDRFQLAYRSGRHTVAVGSAFRGDDLTDRSRGASYRCASRV